MHFIPHTELKGVGPRVPTSQTREDDIFVVSYPKSGATWLQNLISGLVHRVDPATTPDTVIQELVPDVHYKSEYQRCYGNRSFFKSHSLPDPQYRNVVYLLRDGRDAMVSYCHHMGALESPPMQLRSFWSVRTYFAAGGTTTWKRASTTRFESA